MTAPTFFAVARGCGKLCGKVAKVHGKPLQNYVDSVDNCPKKVTFTKISYKTLVKATKFEAILFPHAEVSEHLVDDSFARSFARQLQQSLNGAVSADVHGVEGHSESQSRYGFFETFGRLES